MFHQFGEKLTRVAVFYDGNYFLHVSNYYNFQHARRSRISIRGLHEFVRHQVSEREEVEHCRVKVVDSHYFRARLKAYEAREQNKLYAERLFDDILMNEGVTTHYYNIRRGKKSGVAERDISTWLSLEAFELSMYKQYDVVVLIASDGDYVPLVRKLNTLGIRVMLLSWEFEFVDDYGETRETRTSAELQEEAAYPIHLNKIIDQPGQEAYSDIVDNIFVSQDYSYNLSGNRAPYKNGNGAEQFEDSVLDIDTEELKVGEVDNLLNGYGFIRYDPHNLFFHYTDMVEDNFNDLQIGDSVEFTIGKNDKGLCARNVRLVHDTVYSSEELDY